MLRYRFQSSDQNSTAYQSSLVAPTSPPSVDNDVLSIVQLEDSVNKDTVLSAVECSSIPDTAMQMSEPDETLAGDSTDLIECLQPMPVSVDTPVISREGLRKQKTHVSAARSGPKRKKKTETQVAYLRKLYHRLNGKWDGRVRKEAMQATGLSRIQIYKWFFDMQLQQLPKEKRVAPEEQIRYPPSALQPATVEDLDAGTPRPIFKVERVARHF